MRMTGVSVRRAVAMAVLAAALLAGCGDDEPAADDAPNGGDAGDDASDDESDDVDAGDESDGADDQDDGAPDVDVEAFEITVVDGEASPAFDTYSVDLGDDVRIEITSDVADEVHLHGYDLEVELEPGEPGVLEFTAELEGRFELETHESALQLLQLEVQ